MISEEIVYVMGRGHSGSTVLDAMLGNGVDIVGVGELAVAMDRDDGKCGCGSPLQACPFWSNVRSEFEEVTGIRWSRAAALTRNQAHVARFLWTLRAPADEGDVERLRRINEGVVKAIARAGNATTVVDSTKEVTRGLFLARFLRQARIIHLVRSPTSTLASHLKRIRSGDGFPFLRHRWRARWLEPFLMVLAAINWIVGNFLAGIVARVAPRRVLRVRYEDLCERPDHEVSRIEEFLGRDLSPVREALRHDRPLPLGHKIAGNRLRMSDEFRFRPNRGEDRRLPWYYDVVARALTWPMMLVHGYPVFGLAEDRG